MSRSYSYLNTAKTILTAYKGEIPFNDFLKNFFSKEKKFGSRDRKTIASVCYNYYRTGFSLGSKSIDEVLLSGIFLCSNQCNDILQSLKPEWNEKIDLPLVQKLRLDEVEVATIFPFNNDLSAGIDAKEFNTSFLIQPKVFVRIRPGKQATVKQKLLSAQMDFEEVNEQCLSFSVGSKLEQVLDINHEVVIQDLNSQRVGELLLLIKTTNNAKVWDCCAASGGKSIMAHDMLPGIRITTSDIRPSIIQNLDRRFREAGIKKYDAFVADLTNKKNLEDAVNDKRFDLIICDAPCSGSGTWSRTPERLQYCKREEIIRYANLQKNIVANTIPFVKKGGYFLYITCSVCKQENEEVVEFIREKLNCTLVKMELLPGYNLQADTLFAALFQL